MSDNATDDPVTFTFPAYRLGEFIDKIGKANRRLEGIAQFTFTTEEHLVEKTDKDSGTTVFVPFVTATMTSPLRLTIGDYTFVASLVAEEAGITVHTAPGESLAGWTRPDVDDTHCDHCETNRFRTRLYIVRDNRTGDLLQIGHSCLAKFTGIQPKGLWALTFDEELTGWVAKDSEGQGFSARDSHASIAKVLGMAFAFSDEGRSYISRNAAEAGVGEATGSEVKAAIFFPPRRPSSRDPRVQADWEAWMAKRDKGFEYAKDEALIADILKAAETISTDSDYGQNMAVIVAGEYVSYRNVGTLASLVAVYAREKELAVERARSKPAATEYLGAVGDKVKDLALHVKTVRYWEGDYGTTTFIIGRDDAEHVIVWKASKEIDLEPGDTLHLKSATIKAHDEYKGTLQTVLTRARIA